MDAVVKANRAYTNMSDEKIGARIGKVENEWATPKADSLAKAMLSSDTSTALRRHRELDPWLLKIIVADINGVPVAATVKPLDYAQVDRKFLDGVSAGLEVEVERHRTPLRRAEQIGLCRRWFPGARPRFPPIHRYGECVGGRVKSLFGSEPGRVRPHRSYHSDKGGWHGAAHLA